VLFYDLPYIDRKLDAENPDSPLENFIDSIRPAFDEILTFASDFEQLRDPMSVRTKYQDNISIEISDVEAATDGRTVRVTVVDPDTSDPFNPLDRTSVGWTLIDDENNEFIVNEVHKLSSAFTVVGNVLPVVGDAILRPPVLIDLLAGDFGIEVDQHDPEVYQRSAVKNVFQWLSLKGVERAYDIIGKIAGYRVTAEGLWRLSSSDYDSIPLNRIYELPIGSGNYYTDLDPTRPFFDEIPADIIPLDMFCWETPDWTTEDIQPPNGPLPDETSVSDSISYSLQNLSIYSTTDLGDGYWQVVVDKVDDTGDDITGSAPTMYLNDASALFYQNMVGNKIIISGATSSDNDGEFLITEYVNSRIIGYYNPNGVAEAFAGTWTFDCKADEKIIDIGRWYLNFPSGDDGDFYIEEMPTVLSNRYYLEILAGDSPTFGSTVNINYQCHIDDSCGFCRASAVRVEMTPTEILSDPEALLDNALERMVNKILKVIPIHVRLQNLIHVVGPVEANVAVEGSHIYATVSQTSNFFTYASIGYYFDIVPADELEVDPSHLAATPTQYTIP
jgi:hypothetical protein